MVWCMKVEVRRERGGRKKQVETQRRREKKKKTQEKGSVHKNANSSKTNNDYSKAGILPQRNPNQEHSETRK